MHSATELFPNPTVTQAVHDYCIKHSTPVVAPHIEQHRLDSLKWCQENSANPVMMINPLQVQLLVFLAKGRRAKKVLEIGAFTGYSVLAWAEAVKNIPGAEVIALDLPGKSSEFAQSAFEKYGVDGFVKLITGYAKDTIPTLAGKQFDIIFIDADKPGYAGYLEQILNLDLLAPNGFVLADNALMSGLLADSSENNPASQDVGEVERSKGMAKFNELVDEKVREGVLENVILPIFDGINMIRRKV